LIYILLGAGSGTRMGPLTSDRAKILVEVDGRAILAHNLANIAVADPIARVRIVTGFSSATVTAFIGSTRAPVPTDSVVNPHHAVSGPLRSIEIGLADIDDAETIVTIGNGDTIFQPAALAALASSGADIALLASPAGPGGDGDDVQLLIDDHGIRIAAKHLAADGSLPVSAGLLQIRGRDALDRVREAVRDGLAQEQAEGRMLTWHSILARLAAFRPQAVMVSRDHWWEFDSQESIDRYRDWLGADIPPAD
jgi:choline kinase